VHGCFWHRHDCHLFKWPSTRPEFWLKKIEGNVERDRRQYAELRNEGWRIATIWECALKGRTRLPCPEVVQTCAIWLNSDQRILEIRGDEARAAR
jgi:DNA mismatch endonuclease (patch repair protein)